LVRISYIDPAQLKEWMSDDAANDFENRVPRRDDVLPPLRRHCPRHACRGMPDWAAGFQPVVGLGTGAHSEARQACEADYRRVCAGVLPGGGRVRQCLVEHLDTLSDACKQAVSASKGK
jgi:hypothetical protein